MQFQQPDFHFHFPADFISSPPFTSQTHYQPAPLPLPLLSHSPYAVYDLAPSSLPYPSAVPPASASLPPSSSANLPSAGTSTLPALCPTFHTLQHSVESARWSNVPNCSNVDAFLPFPPPLQQPRLSPISPQNRYPDLYPSPYPTESLTGAYRPLNDVLPCPPVLPVVPGNAVPDDPPTSPRKSSLGAAAFPPSPPMTTLGQLSPPFTFGTAALPTRRSSYPLSPAQQQPPLLPLMSSSPKIKPFISKLAHLLDNPTLYADVLIWDALGDSFIVHHSERFHKEILPRFFGHSQTPSFTRQLNIYGFSRLSASRLKDLITVSSTTSYSAWSHPTFKRDSKPPLQTLTPRPSRARATRKEEKARKLAMGERGRGDKGAKGTSVSSAGGSENGRGAETRGSMSGRGERRIEAVGDDAG